MGGKEGEKTRGTTTLTKEAEYFQQYCSKLRRPKGSREAAVWPSCLLLLLLLLLLWAE